VNETINEDKSSGIMSGMHVLKAPPNPDDLESGQTVMVRLFANQVGPANPRVNSTYIYGCAGDQMFRYLVEEVK